MAVGIAGDLMAVAVATPGMTPIGKVFAFPDGGFVFDAVNDIPVGGIGFPAVRSGSDYSDCTFSDAYCSGAVDCPGTFQLPAPDGFVKNVSDHLFSHRLVGFVQQVTYFFSLTAVPGFPAEQYNGTGLRVVCLREQGPYINGM